MKLDSAFPLYPSLSLPNSSENDDFDRWISTMRFKDFNKLIEVHGSTKDGFTCDRNITSARAAASKWCLNRKWSEVSKIRCTHLSRGRKHAAREHPKKWQNYEFWSILAYFEGFSCKLRPAKPFFPLNCGPRSVFSLECDPTINLSLRLLLYRN